MITPVQLVRGFRHLRALVIGDAMLDTYLEGTAARLCSEGPVPVVRKTSELRAPGGAANTAANLRALDADVVFLSLLGGDMAGTMLRTALRERGIDDSWLVEDQVASTLHKLRILADGQYVVRFDDEDTHAYTEESQQQLLANLEKVFPTCDLVVISDYCYGVLTDELIERLQTLRQAHPCVLLVDSKDLYRFRNVGATVITPNRLEARLLVDRGVTSTKALDAGKSLPEIERIAHQVLALINPEHVAITMAEDGVFLLDRQGNAVHLPAHAVQHANDIGAGDSFAAAMALALAAGGDIEEAARIGIDAAGIAVTKRWTSVVSYQELL
jgi:D-beta-D-heptose 7-phosphate kinase/D-beta-D-heptose 1-phosphate adenosyltransferase